ncbi:MAG TPA: calcium-binding protein [Nocardioidaceae bacterium]|nr:calcium-binding protein [Nocardioidaceae bacterium]
MHRFRVAASAALLFAVLPATSAAANASTPTCHGHRATLVGTSGHDRLVGTPGSDVIVARGGKDRISGRAGNDIVCAGPGDDNVHVGAGNDRVYAGPGWDTVRGGADNDRVYGGHGSDTLRGDAGDDRVSGDLDAYFADRGGQNLVGDKLDGGPGDDVIDPGLDTRHAGGASDTPDILDYRRAEQGVHVDLSSSTGIVTGEGTDRILVEGPLRVYGSMHGDDIVGSAYADTLEGGPGADHIDGGPGDDMISADGDFAYESHAADDVVDGGPGDDDITSNGGHDMLNGSDGADLLNGFGGPVATLRGGPGNDYLFFYYKTHNTEVIARGAGSDVLDVQVKGEAYSPEVSMHADSGAHTVVASLAGADPTSVFGIQRWSLDSSQPWVFDGAAGRDVILRYGPSRLTARTGGGADSVWATTGDDIIDAGAGTDTVHGWRGHDVCRNAEHVTGCESQ